MMTEEQFEQLWQRAEATHYGSRLAGEYPAWHRRSQTRNRLMLGVLGLLVAAAVSLPLLTGSAPDNYEKVYCNRTGTTDAQWASLASDLLIMS